MTEVPKCLSIKQPWAHWIICGDRDGDHDPSASFKDLENRTWNTAYRGPLLIHASKGIAPELRQVAHRRGMQIGGIIGLVDLVDVITATDPRADSPWWIGPYALVLENPRPLPFMPCPGTIAPMFWRPPEELLPAIREQIAE